MLKIRAHFDKPIDLSPLLDELHQVFGEELYSAAYESTPVRSGTTRESWYKTRTDEHTTEITNNSVVGTYQVLSLLHEGTQPHVVGGFNWRAANFARIRPGLRVRINPDKIAVRAVPDYEGDGLPEDMSAGSKVKRYWKAVQFYSYKQDLTEAILDRTELACRRMNNG